ncbi:lytic polysaccharide monooxygenase [Streptomyces sp. Isolate_219]|uniref:lytic polysaccharide monooxygenase auxiliary activity family 9 protein n=1 Tax=Streptomyces sp. Isolate_219 TaxID=2950110 RepID=UPI0021C5A33C|nr:lytic polysaccharide monooxygenase [Streptomyces sp. Isolate_219]MCR8578008.1 lytic polysaccharide monooxygenase [Streptomyces sp. Isolate_219]
MTVRRKATGIALAGIAPLSLTVLTASPAAAHGSMTDPVSRVSACYAEGPESPQSAACKAAVKAGGTQALYDWNGVRDGNAGGQSRTRIPDGKLCSANSAEYKGLDLPRADWPSSPMRAGGHTFHYKATAPHRGSFELYLTKAGYDPKKPLKWSDLESKPFAKVVDPKLVNGEYVFDAKVPARSGRHLIYSVWQRSDSPEAFYTCSDVVFGKKAGGTVAKSAAAPAPAASAPTDAQIAAGAPKSSVGTGHDHGGDHHGGGHHTRTDRPAKAGAPARADATQANAPHPNGGSRPVDGQRLAETGGDSSTVPLALSGAAVLAVGAGVVFTTTRRRAARHRG